MDMKEENPLRLLKALQEQNQHLKEQIEKLQEENRQLREEVARLRQQLGKNSSNSSKPPSEDKGGKNAGGNRAAKQPGQGKNANGGQKEHRGSTLEAVEKPEHRIVHLAEQCEMCGKAIVATDGYQIVGKRQVFDLPTPKLEVTEHQIGEIRCCGVAQKGRYPEQVKGRVQYGGHVAALVVKLSVAHRMPYEQISLLFSDLYGYEINSGTIESMLKEAYEKGSDVEQKNKQAVSASPVAHFDETGLRVAGKTQWLHTAVTETVSYYFVHEKRGKIAITSQQSVYAAYQGWAIHDCFATYFQNLQAKHGLCNAHLVRELQGVLEGGSQWAKAMQAFLWRLYEKSRPAKLTAIEMVDVHKEYLAILQRADQEEHPPNKQVGQRGRHKNTPGRNLLKRLQLHQQAVLAFASEVGVPFSNNLAERALRPAKVKQKISGCFRTITGAAIYARLLGILSTWKKQHLPVFTQLALLFNTTQST